MFKSLSILLTLLLVIALAIPTSARPSLVAYAETENGTTVSSIQADKVINPASIVKAATSLWALEKLGPQHRFETHIGYRGKFDQASNRIDGDLLILGSGDPDFHIENAYLLALQLNQLGIYEITGNLLVNNQFWIGWEGGSEKREKDFRLRAKNMASRIFNALNPTLWTLKNERILQKFEQRRGYSSSNRPRVTVKGQALTEPGLQLENPLFLHQSNPLQHILKRFNAYSNNDIERFGASLGTASDLTQWLSDRWQLKESDIRFETLSGLESNRLSARQVVRLLNDLSQTSQNHQLGLADVLPVAGCDPGTLKHYPRLLEQAKGSLTAKTGTLRYTDGGVSILAGTLDTAQGQLAFCVALHNSGTMITEARKQQENWVLELLMAHGGNATAECSPEPPSSDKYIKITVQTGPALAGVQASP